MFVVPPNYNVQILKNHIPVPCNVGKTSVPTLSKHFGLRLGSDVHS